MLRAENIPIKILNMNEIFNLTLTMIASLVGVIATYLLKNKVDAKKASEEEREIDREVGRVVKYIDESDKDVLSLMVKNVAELREYYVINKQQARNSFSAALFISVLGFLLFGSGVLLSYVVPEKQNVVPYSTIGGAVVEIIAGLFFWLYSKAIKQINIFHTSLQSTEKFLTAIQLVDKISPDQRDESYKNIIDKIISFNFTVAKEQKNDR